MRLRVLSMIGRLARISGTFQTYFWFSDRVSYLARDCWRTPKLSEFSPKAKRKLAVCGIYQPAGLSVFVRRQLHFLGELGFDIALCVPHSLSDADMTFVRSTCRYLVRRENFGRDFGQYKDAVLSIGFATLAQYERVLLLNDSFYFPLGDTSQFERQYRATRADVIGLFENGSEVRHIQSFFLDLSSAVICSRQSQAFWTHFKPYNSRYHAIYKGEVRFSQDVLYKVAATIRLLYSQEAIYQAVSCQLCAGKDPRTISMLLSDNFIPKKTAREKPPDDSPAELLLWQVRQLLECSNISHSFALVVVKLMGAPFIKRDLYFRLSYDLAQLNSLLADDFEDELMDQILTEFRKRGTIRNLSAWDTILNFAGAR